MRHEELLAKIKDLEEDASGDVWLIHSDRCCGNCTCDKYEQQVTSIHKTLRAVVELHKPEYGDFPDEDAICLLCSAEREYVISYPCLTIQSIEKELA